MAQSQSLTLHNAKDYAAFIERNLPFVDLHSGTDTPWWTLPLFGSYSFGYDTGVKMARRLLAFYGSGQVYADNTYLALIVASFIKRHQMIDTRDKVRREACLQGQYSSFFATLSRFLAPAAYVNWQGLNEENNFEPTAVCYPPAWKTPEPVLLTETLEQHQSATCNQERSLMAEHQLIPITTKEIEGDTVQTVNARDLHTFLEVARDFNQWTREQIKRARLVSGRDYVSYEDVGNPSGGRPRKEYAFTTDAAKHVAMMSGSEKGFEIRDYFIEYEKKLRQNFLHLAMKQRFDELQATLSQIEQAIEKISSPATQQQPSKIDYRPEGSISVREMARQVGMKKNQLCDFMKDKGLLERNNKAVEEFVTQGILAYEQRSNIDINGCQQHWDTVCITSKGQAFIRNMLNRE